MISNSFWAPLRWATGLGWLCGQVWIVHILPRSEGLLSIFSGGLEFITYALQL